MEFLLWHGLAISAVIGVSFMLGFLTGRQTNGNDNKRVYRSK